MGGQISGLNCLSYLGLRAGNIYLPDKLLGVDSGGVNFMTIRKKKKGFEILGFNVPYKD